jgi:hypothetical protein
MSADNVKPGDSTSEKKVTDGENAWGIVTIVLGMLLTTGATIAESLGTESKVGIIAGAIIALAGVAQKTLVSLGYIKSRTEVKVATEKGPELED